MQPGDTVGKIFNLFIHVHILSYSQIATHTLCNYSVAGVVGSIWE